MKVFVTGAAGFIGGSIATALVKAGHQVTGLVRSTDQEQEMLALGITPVLGSLDDSDVLAQQASQADAVINAASSDHRGAVEALIKALRGTGKVFLHTSGSSIVGDASGGKASDVIYYEGQLPEPTVDKAARVAIDNLVLAAAPRRVPYFYRTHAGAEIDLLLEKGGQPDIAIEIRRSSAPSPAKGFAQACDDLRITQRYVVYPGSEKFALRHGAQAIGLAELARLLHAESVA